jgi:hypothetical protein
MVSHADRGREQFRSRSAQRASDSVCVLTFWSVTEQLSSGTEPGASLTSREALALRCTFAVEEFC